MNCEQARTSLPDFLLEEVSAAERLEIRQHVDGCEACAGEMARLKQTMTLLVRAEVPEEIPQRDRKSTRLNSSHIQKSRMPSSA